MPRKKTLEEFKQQMLEINPNVQITGQYINNKTPISCRCLKCGHEWEARPDNLLHWGCPNCRLAIIGNKNRKSLTQAIEEFIKVHGDKYDYSKVKYLNSDTKICIICPKHGEFWQSPINHRAGHGCPKCSFEVKSLTNLSNTEEFIKKAIKIHGNLYKYEKVLYISAKTPATIICKKHGEFLQTPNSHLSGKGCPKCNSSKGELLIESFLKERNISFIEQFEIPIDSQINSSGIAYIDFYLPKYNMFIEYNGEQHYKPVKHFGGEIKFNHQKERDKYVRKYAESNNIKLLEISYTLTSDEIINLIYTSL